MIGISKLSSMMRLTPLFPKLQFNQGFSLLRLYPIEGYCWSYIRVPCQWLAWCCRSHPRDCLWSWSSHRAHPGNCHTLQFSQPIFPKTASTALFYGIQYGHKAGLLLLLQIGRDGCYTTQPLHRIEHKSLCLQKALLYWLQFKMQIPYFTSAPSGNSWENLLSGSNKKTLRANAIPLSSHHRLYQFLLTESARYACQWGMIPGTYVPL